MILCSFNSYAKEKNFFCTDDFRFGNKYSLELLKQKIAEGLNVNDQCTFLQVATGLDFILLNIEEPEAISVLEKAGADFDSRRIGHGGVVGNTYLHMAALGKLPEMIPYLLKKGYDMHAKNENGYTPISYACRSGGVGVLKSLISNGADYKYENYYDKRSSRTVKYTSCLVEAVNQANSFEKIKYLYSIDTPKDLPKCDHIKEVYYNCSLFIKIYLNYRLLISKKYDVRVLKLFKDNGEDLNEYFAKNGYKYRYTTILNEILSERPNPVITVSRAKVVNDLIKLGADVNKPEIFKNTEFTRTRETPIFNVFNLLPLDKFRNHYDDYLHLIDLLIKSGANLNHVIDWDHDRLLLEKILAIKDKEYRHKMIKTLISYGLNINTKNKKNENILFQTGDLDKNIETVEFLLSLGANFRIRNTFGETLLHKWSLENNPKLVEKFIRLGTNVNARNNAGYTPLHLSVSLPRILRKDDEKSINKRLKTLKFLLDSGAKINSINSSKNNVFHLAAYYHHPTKVLNFLRERGGDFKAKNFSGTTPFILSAHQSCNGYELIEFKKCNQILNKNFKFFVESGANINHRNKDGYNVLHYAAEIASSAKSVLYLLEKGADHKAKTKNGKTALDLIKENSFLKDSEARWKLHDLSFD